MRQSKWKHLKLVQFLRAPQSIIVTVKVAEDAAEDALVRRRQLLLRFVIERGGGEGDRSLRHVKDLANVLSAAGAALDAALDVLLHNSHCYHTPNTSPVDGRHARGDACFG